MTLTPASDKDIKRIIINMERWRWLPEDLGSVYVWNNSPEFMLYVVRDGKMIYADKTLVGTSKYATPVFDADMTSIIFNPDWIAPETVLVENLLLPLRDGNYSILKVHKLSVSYNGKPVDPRSIDWGRVNIKAFTFTQKSGPDNVLGKVKFWFPNPHTVYMHDTLAYRKKYFGSRCALSDMIACAWRSRKILPPCFSPKAKAGRQIRLRSSGTTASTAPSRSTGRSRFT